MKKLLTAILVVFCFVSASFAKTYTVKAAEDIIELKKSDSIVLELSENTSTGYMWEFTSSDENIAFIENKKIVMPKRKRNSMVKVGEPHKAVYKIKAKNNGICHISGKYVRPWTQDKPIKVYDLTVVVK